MQALKYDVLGIGNAIVDVIVRTDDGFLSDHGIAKGTMRLVDEEQAQMLYAQAGPAVEISGGSAANTIAGVASFGASAAFIGKVQADQLGEVFTHDIRSIGVAYETVPATTGPATARCLVLVTPDGERSMSTFLGASADLGPDDIDEEMIAASRITYLEGYLWDPPGAKQAFIKAARAARAAGRQVALSLSDPFCVDRHRAELLSFVRDEVDILFANEMEIKSLYEVDDFDEARKLARRDCRLAALTRSAAGCVIVRGEELHVIDAVPVERVVDATGAGDLFAAGFLVGLTRGLNLGDCGRLGAHAAAEVISRMGARPERPLTEILENSGLRQESPRRAGAHS